MTDTIFALSSGAPPSAIAIVRISGPSALAVAGRLMSSLPPPRQAKLRKLRVQPDHVLDTALVLVFPGPDSATGEDLVELHVHGGRAVVAAVEAALGNDGLARPAEPGEFTRRAILNGRLDLTEAEGLGDLLHAQTEAQRRAALHVAEGGLRGRVERWTDAVVRIAALVEAAIDHDDEPDVTDTDPIANARTQARALAAELTAAVAAPPAERLHEGIRVVLAGPRNAGKSTLINALVGRDVAIVSPIAGTTRDRIEAAVVREGGVFLLTDTAGLAADTEDEIERIGIALTHEAVAAADIVLWLDDGAVPQAIVERSIAVHARCDLPGREVAAAGRVAVSAVLGEGVDALWTRIAEAARALVPFDPALTLNRRQRGLIETARGELGLAAGQGDPILFAENIRRARLALDRISGRADSEAVLDALFSRFCIGK